MTTRRVISWNLRKSTIVETKKNQEWDFRKRYAVELLKQVNPAVWGAQEATVDQCDDLMSAFPNWTYAGGVRWGNVPIFWNTKVMEAEEGTLLEKKYPSGTRERYMSLIRLQDRHVGWGGWFGSVHLSANGEDEPNSPKLRIQQMTAMVKDIQAWIAAHPHPEDEKPNIIVCGDLNDTGLNIGPRKVAYQLGGWKQLRHYPNSVVPGRLLTSKISGDTLRSFNGWRSTAGLPHDSIWIDEIFTSGVTLEDAALRRACTDTLDSWASDHNLISADIVTTA